MKAERTYPYTAWRLRCYRPVQVTLVGAAYESQFPDWDKDSSGKIHNAVTHIFATKREAVQHGKSEIRAMQSDLMKKRVALAKKEQKLELYLGRLEYAND